MVKRFIRILLTLAGLIGGFILSYYVLALDPFTRLTGVGIDDPVGKTIILTGTIILGLVGFISAPRMTRTVSDGARWAEMRLQKVPLPEILSGTIGLILGLIVAILLGQAFSRVPLVGSVISTVGSLVLGYLGLAVFSRKREDFAGLFGFRTRDRSVKEHAVQPKVLDTNVIIDGRIADICKSGFIEGPIVIPGFVLEELRHIADSSDILKRNRGRRGLDVLNRIQKELNIHVQVYERDPWGDLEVDSKLIQLAKTLDGRVVTNDFNLNKVAELQGVPVLNINELANAVKPVVLPGEEMSVHVIKDGKESGQGVGYLDDGTMIVIDGGRRHIGETIGVMVTSVLQTAAGRMIFARPKAERAMS